MHVELRGGELDGTLLRTGLPLSFLWVKNGRAYRQRRKGARLYRPAHQRAPREVMPSIFLMTELFDYAGYTHRVCEGCGALHRDEGDLRPRCPLCTGVLVRATDLR